MNRMKIVHYGMASIARILSALFRQRQLGIALFLLYLSGQCLCAAPLVVLSDSLKRHPLGDVVFMLEDKAGRLTLEDVSSSDYSNRWRRSERDVPGLGLTSSAFWLRFTIDASMTANDNWLLEISYPLLDDIRLYTIDRQNPSYPYENREQFGRSDLEAIVERPPTFGLNQIPSVARSQTRGMGEAGFSVDGRQYVLRRSGDMLPAGQREVPHRHFLFKIDVGADSVQTVFLRVATAGSLQVPLTLWHPDAFVSNSRNEELLLGLYYGSMLALLLYNLIVFLFLRDWNYLQYSAYVFAMLLCQMALNGMTFVLFWPGWPAWANTSVLVFAGTVGISAIIFTRGFLNVNQNAPPLIDRILKVLAWLLLGVVVYSLFGDYQTATWMIMILATPFIVTILAAAIAAMRSGYRPARYFLIAWSVFLVSLLTYVLKTTGVLPSMFITDYSVQAGSAAEALLLSLALAHRISVLRSENEQARSKARDNEIYRLRNVELADALKEVRSLHERVSDAKEETDALNASLVEANQYLTNLNEEKTEILSIAAHDLKNPLQSIIMNSDLVLRYYSRMSKEKVLESSRINLTTARRINEIITNLLDIHVIESGKLHLNIQEVDLNAIARDVAEQYRMPASNKDISINVQATDRPLRALADSHRTHEVLDNIISNAVKYSSHGKRIDVRVKAIESAVRVEVQDQGPGFTTADKEKLFEKFARLSARPTGGESSTGLGLSIVKRLTEAMEGRVWCESERGFGACFIVELPGTAAPLPETTIPGSPEVRRKDKTAIQVIDAELHEARILLGTKLHAAYSVLVKVLALSEEHRYAAGKAEALRSLGEYHFKMGQAVEAGNYLEEALDLFENLDNLRSIAITLTNLGIVYGHLDQFQEARDFHERSIDQFRSLEDPAGEVHAMNNLAQIDVKLGNFDGALNTFHQCLTKRRAANDLQGEAFALNNIGMVYHRQQRYDQALEAFYKSLALKEEQGDQYSTANTLINIGEALLAKGQPLEALAQFERGKLLRRRLRDRSGEAYALCKMGSANTELDAMQPALEDYQQSLALFREADDRSGIAECLLLMAGWHHKQGDYHQEGLLLERVVETPVSFADQDTIAAAHRQLARLCEDNNDPVGALAHFKKFTRLQQRNARDIAAIEDKTD